MERVYNDMSDEKKILSIAYHKMYLIPKMFQKLPELKSSCECHGRALV